MPTIPESHRELLETDTGMLATFGQDGFPQVTATWFLLDNDGVVKMSLNTARQKVKNLRRRPECTFFVLDLSNPYRTLEIRARADLSLDDDYGFADKVGKKYGMDFRTIDQPGESRVVVSLHPVKVNTYGS